MLPNSNTKKNRKACNISAALTSKVITGTTVILINAVDGTNADGGVKIVIQVCV